MRGAYVLISPCKDEARHIERTLASVAAQTVKPAQWVIVDDGSVDESMDIVARWRERLPFLRVIRRDVGPRDVGPGVVRAFTEGLAAVDARYEFLCKFDADLELPPRYFEIMLAHMAADPDLGTCSGKPFYRHPRTGAEIDEIQGDEQSAGQVKFYRRACFEAIGGFETGLGWDAFDCHKARWMGWRAWSRSEPEIRFEHLRPMGSSQTSIYRGRIRHGRGTYLLGAHPLFFCAAALRRALIEPPRGIGSAYLAYGYFHAMLTGAKRHGDPKITRFIRRFQLRALIRGKRASAETAFQERRAADLPKLGQGVSY